MISSLQLARICGVSQGTIDRALHDRGRIREETRRRILAAAAKHGYVPNPAAREMMTGTSTVVGAVIPSINSLFFMDLMESVRCALRGIGLRLVLSSAVDRQETLAVVREYAARRMSAVVIVPPESSMTVPQTLTRETPVVSLVNPCRGRNVPCVAPDEKTAGREGVEYLVSRGHRRVLFLSYTRRSWAMIAREKGYRSAMAVKGLEPRLLIGVDEHSLHRELRSYRPSALFCHNDWLALSAIRYLAKTGVKVPHDISVLGIDNSPSFVSLFPEITTLEYPAEDIARRIVGVLTGTASNGAAGRFNLIERQTVATFRHSKG